MIYFLKSLFLNLIETLNPVVIQDLDFIFNSRLESYFVVVVRSC